MGSIGYSILFLFLYSGRVSYGEAYTQSYTIPLGIFVFYLRYNDLGFVGCHLGQHVQP